VASQHVRYGAAVALGSAAVALSLGAWAAGQVRTDGTVGAATTLTGPNFAIGAGLGQQRGANLFHSFATFNLVNGEAATFSGPGSVANIIARVTGGASSIDGTIASSIPRSNLFFLNPAGVMFGQNAHINVPGAFHAATADYLRFADGATFGVTTPNGSSFTTAAPQAFGFMGSNPASVAVNGTAFAPSAGQQLSLIGSAGGVSLNGATITALPGTVHIASVAGRGEIGVDPTDAASLTATSFGPVSLSNATLVRANNSGTGAPGTIEIRGGQIAMTGGSEVISSTRGAGAGPDINVIASGSLTIDGTQRADINTGIGSFVRPGATGRGGAVNVQVRNALTLVGGGLIASETAAAGNGGPISINAGTLTADAATTPLFGGVFSAVDGSSAIFALNGLSFQFGVGTGNAGDVTVQANQMTLTGTASLASYTFGRGNGGKVSAIGGNILIDSSTAPGVFTGVNSLSFSNGNAGPLNVQGNQITITGDGQITSQAFARGNTGDVTVSANSILIDGSNAAALVPAGPTGISTQSNLGATGTAGTVNVQASQITLRAGGEIDSITSTGTKGGKAGTVAVNAGSVSIDGNGSSFLAGIFSIVGPQAREAAGSVQVTANDITMANTGQIESNTSGNTNAGQVTVNAGALSIQGNDTKILTGIATNAIAGAGNAGEVTVNADSVSLSSGAQIASNTFSSGNGGNVTVSVSGGVLVQGINGLGSPTAISAKATQSGSAGTVTLFADNLTLLDGGIISTQAAQGGGGNITIHVSDLLHLERGQITTSVTGGIGNGGNILIDPQFTVLNPGTIRAQAALGHGGTITIDPNGGLFFASPDSLISASAGNPANDGTVLIEAPSTDVTASIAELSGKIAPPPQIAKASCTGAAAVEKSSSLTLGGRGGLPESGEGPLAGNYFLGRQLEALTYGEAHMELAEFGNDRSPCTSISGAR